MPDATPPTDPATPVKKKRATPQTIARTIQAQIQLADTCARAAADPAIMAALADRDWTDQKQSTLRAAVGHALHLTGLLSGARGKKKTRTREEEAARLALLTALDPILIGARRTFPEPGDPNRALFGIGQNLSTVSTTLLYRLAVDTYTRLTPQPSAAAEFTLLGVKPAEITVLQNLGNLYREADFAQTTAQLDAGDILDQLTAHLRTTINPLRRELQLAADQEWSWRIKQNRTKRLAFGIPADRPAGE